MVLVWRRMYARQLSEPLSRPPPVSFSPPNAPPISAPDGPMLTLAIPQSEPRAETNRSALREPLAQPPDELVGDAVVDDQPPQGRAALPGGAGGREQDGAGGELEVGA